MFHHCGGDHDWSIESWNHRCMNRDTWQSKYGQCCMVYLFAGQDISNQLQYRTCHKGEIVNACYQGELHKDCLVKQYPCINYLFHRDRSNIQFVIDKYSDCFPDDVGAVKIIEEQFEKLYGDCKNVIEVKLLKGESLSAMKPVFDRFARERALALDWSDCIWKPALSHEVTKDITLPVRTFKWVYVVNKHWIQISQMREFEGDTNYYLLKLSMGWLMRMRKSAVDAGFLICESRTLPTDHPDISQMVFFDCQIYIYHCLDGYYEWFREMGRNPSLFPFNNKDCKHFGFPLISKDMEDSFHQMNRAGQLVLRTHIERGQDLLGKLFDELRIAELDREHQATRAKAKEVQDAKKSDSPPSEGDEAGPSDGSQHTRETGNPLTAPRHGTSVRIRRNGRYWCTEPNCPKQAQLPGYLYCISHGGGSMCNEPGCARGSLRGKDGFCYKHGGGCRENGCRIVTTSRYGFCKRHGG